MENNTNTEIDLWQLIHNGFTFLKKRKWLIVSCFLLGLLFSISNFFTHPLEYKSFYKKEYIAQSSLISNEILSDVINSIPVNLKEQNNSIADFPEFRSIIGKLQVNRLKVIVEAYNPKDIDSTLHAIRTYVNSFQDIKEKYDFSKQQNLQLLSILNKKIAECDSAKKHTEYLDYIDMMIKKQSVEKELSLNKIVNFIPINPDSTFISNTRAGMLNVLGYSFLGIVIGFLIAFAMNLIQRK